MKTYVFDESMPIGERAAWAGLRDLFEQHAAAHGFLVEDMLVSRMPGAGEARRSLVARLNEEHRESLREKYTHWRQAIGWLTGLSEGYVSHVLTWDRRRRGLPSGVPDMTDREMRKRWDEIMGRPLPDKKKLGRKKASQAALVDAVKQAVKSSTPDAVVMPAPQWEELQRALSGDRERKAPRRARASASLLGDDPEPTEE